MRDHDDLDLSAWEAPPPPDGLADAVIARMGGTAVGLAMPVDHEPRRRRTLVIAASAAAVLAATLGTWVVVRGREHAPPGSGAVVAERAQHLELGGVAADLDRGAEVTWRRDGARVQIQQKAGTVVWRVGGDQQVVIGAAVASPVSIDATGATLRVEVPMNMSDARVIGASAITAAAVAMVTVVVYEGHVKATSGGQTVVVQPGSTFTVPPPAPPEPEPPVVGVAPVDDQPATKKRIAILGLEQVGDDSDEGDRVARELTEGLRMRAKVGTGAFQLAPGSDKELVDEKLLHDCHDEEPACMAEIGDDLGADTLLYGKLEGEPGNYVISIQRLDVKRKVIERVSTEVIAVADAHGAALQTAAKRIYAKLTDAATAATTCDADRFADQGTKDVSLGQHAAGLANFEEALRCRPGDERLTNLAFMAACNAHDLGAARGLYKKLSADWQPRLLQICIRNGITADQLSAPKVVPPPPACDADDLEEKGTAAEGVGQHAMALTRFEQALKCKPADPKLVSLAFMAACNMKYLEKARTYWRAVPSARQAMLLQLCLRQGITRDELDSGGPAPAGAASVGTLQVMCNPPAKVRIDGVDTGQTTPAMIKVTPGKHKLTFVLGEDRFTYPVTAKAGETTTISKDLQ